jgi:hypothetical protein
VCVVQKALFSNVHQPHPNVLFLSAHAWISPAL